MDIFVDESGFLNSEKHPDKKFFIALIKSNNSKRLRKHLSKFIKANLDDLKINSRHPEYMFKDNAFKELKGSALIPRQKHSFISFFSQKDYFGLYIIEIDNAKVKKEFCAEQARAFNYVLKKALESFYNNNLLSIEEPCFLQIDERNEKTNSKSFLQEYLNTELPFAGINEKFKVEYFNSQSNHLVQVADVFANIFYSNQFKKEYEKDLKMMKSLGILKGIFTFPIS